MGAGSAQGVGSPRLPFALYWSMPESLAHLGTPVEFWAFSSLWHFPGKWLSPRGLDSLSPRGTLGPLWLLLAKWDASQGLTGPLLFPQLGLLVDLSPDGLMIPEDGVNDEELEAEFLALVGGQPQALEKLKGKGETLKPPLEHFLSSHCRQDSELGAEEMERRQRRFLPSWNLQSGLKVK